MDYKKEYDRLLRMLIKPGMRIRLISMNDGDTANYPVKPSVIEPKSLGTVSFIDDAMQIHVIWDSGRALALIPESDEFEILGYLSEEKAR